MPKECRYNVGFMSVLPNGLSVTLKSEGRTTMSFILTNPNPYGLNVGDCSVRAISIATDKSWDSTFLGLALEGYMMKDMPSSNRVWSSYLDSQGFKLYLIPDSCPECYTVSDFCREFPKGTYLVGTGHHVICIKDGSIMDSWDSSMERPLYFWKKGVDPDV